MARTLDAHPIASLLTPLSIGTVSLLGLYALGALAPAAVVLLAGAGMAYAAFATAVQSRMLQLAPGSTDMASAGVSTASDAAEASIVDSTVWAADGPAIDALLDQLAVVRPLLGAPDALRLVHRSDRTYVITGGGSGPRVTMTGVSSVQGRSALALDVVAPARRWQVRFDDTALASPTEITVHDAAGARSQPLVYESGRRVGWQRLHEAMRGTGDVAYPLDRLADDMELVRRMLGVRGDAID